MEKPNLIQYIDRIEVIEKLVESKRRFEAGDFLSSEQARVRIWGRVLPEKNEN